MMDSFIFPGLMTRVVFGAGTMARVEEEVRRLGHDKALVLSTPHQKADVEKLVESLRGLAVGIFPGAVMHTPVEVTDRALQAFRASGASGGGRRLCAGGPSGAVRRRFGARALGSVGDRRKLQKRAWSRATASER